MPELASSRRCGTRSATPASTRTRSTSLSRYWAAVRELYYPFEEGLKAPSADVYQHEMPGGQYTNLRQQAQEPWAWRTGGRSSATRTPPANQLFGDIVKVTPSSKVVGDMALFMVTNKLSPARHPGRPDTAGAFPRSVVEMMQGMLGRPEGGWPQRVAADRAARRPAWSR